MDDKFVVWCGIKGNTGCPTYDEKYRVELFDNSVDAFKRKIALEALRRSNNVTYTVMKLTKV